ncbi:MAG: HD domain-containing protein [Gemmatimonadaceae bacterium]|nr:HD domain-containing protein [Gemmatimonadaceae bacterium]
MEFPLPPRSIAPRTSTVRLAEVLSALTYALDLTEGQRPGHTLRTALIAMRLGRECGLDAEQMGALYYAALLKDAGCSSNAARMAALFGTDDQLVNREMRLVDWHDRWRVAMRTAQNCGVGRNPLARIQHFLRIAQTPQMTREIIQARCERGAQIAVSLGFPSATSEAIGHVDEHWCGLGHPVGLAGDEIPVLSRILLLSQTFEAFWTEQGLRAATRMMRSRSARWFDPTMVSRVETWRHDASWWGTLTDIDHLTTSVVALEPGSSPLFATDDRIDAIAYAFAAVIDAKTPFTYRHSTNVARYATAIAAATGADRETQRTVLRAGLLHDVGKLGVSNCILDKPGRLTDGERAEIMKHPRWTLQILDRVTAFRSFASASAHHHERLDGGGYPWALGAEHLDYVSRVLAIADVYEALTADRPYREGMSVPKVLGIMGPDAGKAFDPVLLDAAVTLAERGVFADLASGAADDPVVAIEKLHAPMRERSSSAA